MTSNSKIYVTGVTGFIGRHVARALINRGFSVTGLTRNRRNAKHLDGLPIRLVEGDVTNRLLIRETIAGHDSVIHLAGWFEFGIARKDARKMYEINVEGTRNVLEEAWRSGAKRIVYGSTVGALGSSGPADCVGDEQQVHNGMFQSVYVKTKYEAHRVARVLARQGAPIVITLPEAAYGPGCKGIMREQLFACCRGKMSTVPAATGIYCYTHVEDIAEGMWLALTKGQTGHEYVLAGPALTLADFYSAVATLAGVRTPRRRIPNSALRALAWVLDSVPGARTLSGKTLNQEAVAMITDANWAFSSKKAERELGWRARSLDDGLRDTVEWVRNTLIANANNGSADVSWVQYGD